MNREKKKNFWELIRPNTLVKKCIYAICTVTAVMLLAAGNLMTDCVYGLLKPRMQHDFEVLTSGVSTKISYLLHQNTQYLLKFWLNEEFCSEVVQYVQEEAPSQKLRQDIENELAAEKRGSDEPGAIVSTRNIIVITDWEEMICKPEMEAYGEAIIQSQWFSELPQRLEHMNTYEHDRLKRQYSPVFQPDDEMGTEEFISLVMVKELQDHEILLFMVEPFEEFRNLFDDFLIAGIKDFCMIGIDGEILFQNQENSEFQTRTPEEIESLFAEEQYKINLMEKEESSVIGVRLSYQIEQLKLTACLSKEDFLKPYKPFVHMMNGMLVGFTVILLFLVIVILNRSLYRLKKLVVQMKEVRDETYSVPKSIQSNDEVGMLADTFYQMMDQIQENIEKLKEKEKKEKRIEYSLLVSQIDPHFIYNTLSTITYLAELNQTDDIMILNQALIAMLRDRLKMTKLQIYDTLEREKQQLESYMTIQKYLCNNEIMLKFPVSEECAKLKYPKNILQPLVENSILHGILLHRDENENLIPGKIQICVSVSNGRIVTEIEDNGIGMTEENIKRYFCELPLEQEEMLENETREHIGIYNIRMRMNYLYGERFHIFAHQKAEGGLKVHMEFPVT